MDKENYGLYMTIIVAIVAVVGLVFMFGGTSTLNSHNSNSNQADLSGNSWHWGSYHHTVKPRNPIIDDKKVRKPIDDPDNDLNGNSNNHRTSFKVKHLKCSCDVAGQWCTRDMSDYKMGYKIDNNCQCTQKVCDYEAWCPNKPGYKQGKYCDCQWNYVNEIFPGKRLGDWCAPGKIIKVKGDTVVCASSCNVGSQCPAKKCFEKPGKPSYCIDVIGYYDSNCDCVANG